MSFEFIDFFEGHEEICDVTVGIILAPSLTESVDHRFESTPQVQIFRD